jgi:hypothetical protein
MLLATALADIYETTHMHTELNVCTAAAAPSLMHGETITRMAQKM